MKKYYVGHIHGMNTDAEYMAVRDRLLVESLIDPDQGREYRRVRHRDGRVTEGAFLHLWDTRAEAEGFASRLSLGENDHRWKVVEVDVEGTIKEILDPLRLPLPKSPRVKRIETQPYIDSSGEDSLQIEVLIEDKACGGLYEWSEVSEIHRAIQDTLTAEGINLYPYVHFLTVSEAAEQHQDV